MVNFSKKNIMCIFICLIFIGCSNKELLAVRTWLVTDDVYTFDEEGYLVPSGYEMSYGFDNTYYPEIPKSEKIDLPGFFYSRTFFKYPLITYHEIKHAEISISMTERCKERKQRKYYLLGKYKLSEIGEKITWIHTMVYLGERNFRERKKDEKHWPEKLFNSTYSDCLKDSIFYETCVMKRVEYDSSYKIELCF